MVTFSEVYVCLSNICSTARFRRDVSMADVAYFIFYTFEIYYFRKHKHFILNQIPQRGDYGGSEEPLYYYIYVLLLLFCEFSSKNIESLNTSLEIKSPPGVKTSPRAALAGRRRESPQVS
ncbi:hypothetical protein C0J52_10232 [Blattella germanica]|nr:hypothetical protein C0J52_10232 [Blattella germanica]